MYQVYLSFRVEHMSSDLDAYFSVEGRCLVDASVLLSVV